MPDVSRFFTVNATFTNDFKASKSNYHTKELHLTVFYREIPGVRLQDALLRNAVNMHFWPRSPTSLYTPSGAPVLHIFFPVKPEFFRTVLSNTTMKTIQLTSEDEFNSFVADETWGAFFSFGLFRKQIWRVALVLPCCVPLQLFEFRLTAVHFYASWAPQCDQLNVVLADLQVWHDIDWSNNNIWLLVLLFYDCDESDLIFFSHCRASFPTRSRRPISMPREFRPFLWRTRLLPRPRLFSSK